MKWRIVKKGDKYRRKLVLDEVEWLILTWILAIACVIVLCLIFEGV